MVVILMSPKSTRLSRFRRGNAKRTDANNRTFLSLSRLMPLTDERADIDFQILRENESKKIARGRERRGKGKEGGRERPSAAAAVC